jgi:hypothetical protein
MSTFQLCIAKSERRTVGTFDSAALRPKKMKKGTKDLFRMCVSVVITDVIDETTNNIHAIIHVMGRKRNTNYGTVKEFL